MGRPGVGKYTIAQALFKKKGYVICDNQLINNPIFQLLQYDGYARIPPFAWDSIARIRNEIFSFLCKEPENHYVLTNCLFETKEDRDLFQQVQTMANVRDSLFVPVRLNISKDEHLKRLTRIERRKRWKSIDPKEADTHVPLLSINHPHFLELDVTYVTPCDCARFILQHIDALKRVLF